MEAPGQVMVVDLQSISRTIGSCGALALVRGSSTTSNIHVQWLLDRRKVLFTEEHVGSPNPESGHPFIPVRTSLIAIWMISLRDINNFRDVDLYGDLDLFSDIDYFMDLDLFQRLLPPQRLPPRRRLPLLECRLQNQRHLLLSISSMSTSSSTSTIITWISEVLSSTTISQIASTSQLSSSITTSIPSTITSAASTSESSNPYSLVYVVIWGSSDYHDIDKSLMES